MLATLIREAYRFNEAEAVAKALDELCSPTDNEGWASAGVYVFWDYATRKILYVGLAVDLAQRFRQHNGLISCKPSGCKIKQIKEYFKTHEFLGYSVFVQSPLDQPLTAKLRHQLGSIDIEDISQLPSEAGRANIKILEGNLIQAQFILDNALPPWNKISGAKEGKENAKPGHHRLTDLAAKGDDDMVARSTLRQLADDLQLQIYEDHLHIARVWQLMGMAFVNNPSIEYGIQQVIRMDFSGMKKDLFQEMKKSGYLTQKAPFTG